MATVLIVDDEKDIRKLIAGLLSDEGHKTLEACDKKEALAYFAEGKTHPDAVLLDIWLEGGAREGLEILSTLKEQDVDAPILMMSGHGTLETAVEAIKKGAYDFLEKPFKTDRLMILLNRALEQASIKKRLSQLENDMDDGALITKSKKMQDLMEEIDKAAPTNSRILLTGEAGAGKSIIAKYIHARSNRQGGLHTVSGAGFDADFTKQALGGTVIIEQPEDLNADEQKKLTHTLQEDHKIRYITTTRADLKSMVEQGRFREDLFYRLNVVPLHLPPLRERKADLPDLINLIIPKVAHRLDITTEPLSQNDMNWLLSQNWPGNVRELKNTLERFLILGRTQDDDTTQLNNNDKPSNVIDLSLKEARENFERDYLQAQLNKHEKNIAATAETIGMDRAALHRKIKQLGIQND